MVEHRSGNLEFLCSSSKYLEFSIYTRVGFTTVIKWFLVCNIKKPQLVVFQNDANMVAMFQMAANQSFIFFISTGFFCTLSSQRCPRAHELFFFKMAAILKIAADIILVVRISTGFSFAYSIFSILSPSSYTNYRYIQNGHWRKMLFSVFSRGYWLQLVRFFSQNGHQHGHRIQNGPRMKIWLSVFLQGFNVTRTQQCEFS